MRSSLAAALLLGPGVMGCIPPWCWDPERLEPEGIAQGAVGLQTSMGDVVSNGLFVDCQRSDEPPFIVRDVGSVIDDVSASAAVASAAELDAVVVGGGRFEHELEVGAHLLCHGSVRAAWCALLDVDNGEVFSVFVHLTGEGAFIDASSNASGEQAPVFNVSEPEPTEQ